MGRYQANEVVHHFFGKELQDVDVLNLKATALGSPFLRKPGLLNLSDKSLDCDGALTSRVMLSRYTLRSCIKLHENTGFFDTFRLTTVASYLNEGFEGGETYFTDISTKIRPAVGDLLFLLRNRHGVTSIRSSARLCLATFCDDDLAY